MSKIKDIQQFVDEVSDTEIYDAKERVSRIAKIAEIVDIISCNYQEQWYELIHEQIPDKLILGTEVYEYFAVIMIKCKTLQNRFHHQFRLSTNIA